MLWQSTVRLYRDAYSGHPKEIWSLAWLTLINRTGTMVLPFLSVYATTVLHFSLEQAGLIVACFGFGSLGGSFFGGKLSDRIGGKWVIILSLLLGGMVLFSLQWARTMPALMSGIFLAALLGEAYRPAMSTLIAQYVPKERFGRSMAFIRLAINLGFSAGPAVGGFLAVTLGYQWLFWIDGLTCILAALFFLVISRQWTVVRTRKKDQKASGQVLSAPVYKNRAFIFFIVSTVLMAFTFVQWFHTVPVFLKTDWGFDERVYGMMMGISSLIIVLVEMPLIHYIEENGFKRKALQWGLILLGGSFVAFQFPGALFFCTVAMLFFTFGEILYLPLNNSFSLLLSSDDRRGEYMSWYWMSWSIANILGPSIGFLLIAQLGYAFFWAFLLLLLAGSFMLNFKVSQ